MNRPWYRYGQRSKALGGGWYAFELGNVFFVVTYIVLLLVLWGKLRG